MNKCSHCGKGLAKGVGHFVPANGRHPAFWLCSEAPEPQAAPIAAGGLVDLPIPGAIREYPCERTRRWDARFLALADQVATWSKDPSTQCGAVLVRPDLTVASLGYNGFARGLSDAPERFADRDVKMEDIIHAEMNAVLTAREPVAGMSLFTNAPCCPRCVNHMIQAGVRRFVFWNATEEQYKRWKLERTFAALTAAVRHATMYQRPTPLTVN